jgi:SAM-dependent methyltransferase
MPAGAPSREQIRPREGVRDEERPGGRVAVNSAVVGPDALLNPLLRPLKGLGRRLYSYNPESRTVLRFVRRVAAERGRSRLRVLDVGCGYGKLLRLLLDLGHDAVGVDVNREIVEDNAARGLPCLPISQLPEEAEFDLVIMSHLIEHFAPEALLNLLERYLDRVAPGGFLLVSTPLYSRHFFDDFDHVKPYHPAGLLMVFGAGSAQVQYYGRTRLELADLSYRRSMLRAIHWRARFLGSPTRLLLHAVDLASAAAYFASFKLIAKKDGWIGLFRKI